MKIKLDIRQSYMAIQKKDLNIISVIGWFESGEQAIYLLNENGKYSWQAISSNNTKISLLEQGIYSLHVEKLPPVVFVKPMTEENHDQLSAISELMFSQYPEINELPVVNAEGNIVAVVKMLDPSEQKDKNMDWESLKNYGSTLPDEKIFVSSLANPRIENFFHAFEDTGKVNLLTNDNIDSVLNESALLVFDHDIFGSDVNKINICDLYDSMYFRNVIVCGDGGYISVVANNIRKHFPKFRIVKEINISKEKISLDTGCIAACSSKTVYDKLVGDLATIHMPLLDLHENKKLIHVSECAQKTYSINDSNYPVYVLTDVYGIPNLMDGRSRFALALYDANGNIYDCSFSYMLPKIPSMLNCLQPLETKDEEIDIDVACYVCEDVSNNYWHFTFQIMNRLFAMEESGFTGKYIVYDVTFTRQMLQLLGIPDERIVWFQKNENIRYKIHELHYVHFFENAHGGHGIGVLNRFASVILENSVTYKALSRYPKRVFVKRVGSRKLLGVDKILEEFGFYTVLLEEHSVLEQVLYFHAADVVLASHGAGSANSIYMHDGATFIETFSRSYINPCCSFTMLTSERRIKYRMVVDKGAGVLKDPNIRGDYTIPDELLRLTLLEACNSK